MNKTGSSYHHQLTSKDGYISCKECVMVVNPVYEYAWCGTQPFQFCPNDPERPSEVRKKRDAENKRMEID